MPRYSKPRSYYRGKRNPYSRYRSMGQSAGKVVAATAPAAGYLAMRAAKMVAKRYLNVEYKVKDTAIAQTTLNTGHFHCLSLIAEGNTEQQRDGKIVRATALTITGDILINASATNSVVRMIIFRDNDMNGQVPNTPTFSGQYGILDATDFRSNKNLKLTKRYNVIMDKIYRMDQVRQEQIIVRKFFRQNHQMEYRGVDADIASTMNGQIYVGLLSNEATDGPLVTLKCRLRYLDN